MEQFSFHAEGAPAGSRRRGALVRIALAIVVLGGLVWALPVRQPGQEGGHHGAHPPQLDAFEKAGVTEFKEGQRGPAFRLTTLDGRQASLEDWRDNAIVLNFWATWCQPCTLEMPTLEALWRAYRERGVVVVGIAVDRDSPRALLDPYVKNLDLTFPILLDPDMSTANAWRVTGIPATFVIRPGGEVAGMAVGAREWNSPEMRALLDIVLGGPEMAPQTSPALGPARDTRATPRAPQARQATARHDAPLCARTHRFLLPLCGDYGMLTVHDLTIPPHRHRRGRRQHQAPAHPWSQSHLGGGDRQRGQPYARVVRARRP